ncbi:tripartite tricarboxylate transporter TctB family protein [soil metagenome]
MSRLKKLNRDQVGALLLIAMGVAVLVAGLSYRMGNLNHMGAGYIPVVLGILMAAMGIAIGATSVGPAVEGSAIPTIKHEHHDGFEFRGWLCILGGVAAFVVLGSHLGFIAGTFGAVFISAMGDRNNTWKTAAVLAAIVTAFGTAVFIYGLSLQIPLFQFI